VTAWKAFLTLWGNLRIKKSTKIWFLVQEVRGREKRITTDPTKPTISKVPRMGLRKERRMTSAVVRRTIKTRAVPAITFRNRLNARIR
jgi:hypothetical protein